MFLAAYGGCWNRKGSSGLLGKGGCGARKGAKPKAKGSIVKFATPWKFNEASRDSRVGPRALSTMA